MWVECLERPAFPALPGLVRGAGHGLGGDAPRLDAPGHVAHTDLISYATCFNFKLSRNEVYYTA